MRANPALQAATAGLQAAERRVQAVRLGYRGELRAELDAGAFERRFGGDDKVAVGLVLELPLYTGGAKAASLAKVRAEVRQSRADLVRRELELRQAVLDLWLEIQRLHAQREQVEVLGRYRDLYLDRSRARYELELTADLGDAMVGTSDHSLQQARTEYAIALAWARLDALTGSLLPAAESGAPTAEKMP
jgi:outer membrane protein TolC